MPWFLICFAALVSTLNAEHLIINRSLVNMYAQPDKMHPVISQVIYGAQVTPLDKAGDWIKVCACDGCKGWIEESAIVKSESSYPKTCSTAKIKDLFAHVYMVDDVVMHQPLMTLPFETVVEIVTLPEQEKTWARIKLVDGSLAWIQRGDLTFNPRAISLEEMLALSKKFIGLPFRWGGTSSFGYDSSGYAQMLFRQMGILLPRESTEQFTSTLAAPVETGSLLPGDLIFFEGSDLKIANVGIYLGNEQFVHSTIVDKPIIQISTLSEPMWKEKYRGARRFWGEKEHLAKEQ